MDVRGPIERVESLSVLVHVHPLRHRRPRHLSFRSRLLHLRQQARQALRRCRSALAQQRRHLVVRVPLNFREEVRASEVLVLR